MALTQLDIPDEIEEKIQKFKLIWKLNKRRTILEMLKRFEL